MKSISQSVTFDRVRQLLTLDRQAAFNEYVDLYRQHDWLSDYRIHCSQSAIGLDGVEYVRYGHLTRETLERRQYQFTFHDAAPRIVLHVMFSDVRFDPKTFKTIEIEQLCFDELVEAIPLYWKIDNYTH